MITQNLDTLLIDHVTLDIEGIDRMYLKVYQPLLQTEGGVCHFFKHHRKQPVVSTVLMAPMTQNFIQDIKAHVQREGIEVVRFRNAALYNNVAELLGLDKAQYSPGAMTYNLRGLRLHGLIEKIPNTHRYQPTQLENRRCQFFKLLCLAKISISACWQSAWHF